MILFFFDRSRPERSYNRLVKFLEERKLSNPKGHYEVLYNIATRQLDLDDKELSIHYLNSENEILQDSPETFLFHGTTFHHSNYGS